MFCFNDNRDIRNLFYVCAWYGHVLRKDDDDWVKKCMEDEVESPRPRGRPKRTWREVVREDCQACKLNKEDAIDRCKWRKVIKDVWWSGWVWVGECFFRYRPTRVVPDKRPLNGCVCVCVCVCVILCRTNIPRKQGGLGEMKIPLLADKSHAISRAYGVLKEEVGNPYR